MRLVDKIIDDVPNIFVITRIEVLRFNTTATAYQVLEDFINESVVLNLTDDVVKKTIAVCKSYRVKLPDAIIAATAIANNLTLVTRNEDDFNKIQAYH